MNEKWMEKNVEKNSVFYKNYGYQNPQFPKKKVLDRADHIICISKY